jgi:hypothetical protein
MDEEEDKKPQENKRKDVEGKCGKSGNDEKKFGDENKA